MASREVNVNLKVDDLIDVKAIVDKLRAERDAAVARAEAAETEANRLDELLIAERAHNKELRQAVARVREWVKEDGESALVFKVSIRAALDGIP